MTSIYFDASALVKLVIDEDGSDLAAALWDRADTCVSSRLAYPEVMASLAASHRNTRLTAAGWRSAARAFSAYWAAMRPVDLTSAVEQHSGTLAGAHGLRGADAVHLASALAVPIPNLVVAVWDRRLHKAAAAVGLGVAPLTLA